MSTPLGDGEAVIRVLADVDPALAALALFARRARARLNDAGSSIRTSTARVSASVSSAGRSLRDFARNVSDTFGQAGDSVRRGARRIGTAASSVGRGLRRAGSTVAPFGRGLASLGSSALSAASSMVTLGAGVQGFAAQVGIAALPAIGALVPVLAGMVTAGITAKLAFHGIGDAVQAAGEDQKKYAEELKKLSAPQQDFVKAVVGVKKEFSGLGKEVQKVVLPPFTKALKAAGPALDIVKGGIRDTAKVFADFGDEFGKLFASGRFQEALKKNIDLGTGFLGKLISPLDTLTQSILDFGAASGPTLDAFGTGISGLLGKGIPGFLDGLKSGIQGSADLFNGLFDAVNRLLPAIGRAIGSIADVTGPAPGSAFSAVGDVVVNALDKISAAVQFLKPVIGEIAGAFRIASVALGVFLDVAANTAQILLSSLWPSFGKAKDAVGSLQSLADWFDRNRGSVLEFTRVASRATSDFFNTIIQATPTVVHAFGTLIDAFLAMGNVFITGAADLFGWIPGIGPALKRANTSFDSFRKGVQENMKSAEDSTRDFAERAGKRLTQNELKLDVSNYTQQLNVAREQLSEKNLPKTRQVELKARIDDLKNKIAESNVRLNDTVRPRRVSISGKIDDLTAKLKSAQGQIKTATGPRRVFLLATIRDAQAKIAQLKRELASVRNQTVTFTVNRVNRIKTVSEAIFLAKQQAGGRARGGLVPGLASGGPVPSARSGLFRGKGSSTSDSNLVAVSDNEFIVQASAVRKYGVEFFNALNAMKVPLKAAGGSLGSSLSGTGADIASGLVQGLRGSLGTVRAASRDLALSVVQPVTDELEISSPSRRMNRVGQDAGRGLHKGLSAQARKVLAAQKAFAKALAKIGQDLGRGYVQALTGTSSQIKSRTDKIANDIIRAFQGRKTTKDDRLVRFVDAGNRRLQSLAAQREKVTRRIADAQQFASETAAQAREAFSLASVTQGDEGVSRTTIIRGLNAGLVQIKRFQAQILSLRKRGLSKSLLSQLIGLGPQAGAELAQVLSSQSSASLKQINSLQSRINTASSSLGRAGADILFDTGKQVGNGFLAGLKSQQKQIENLMISIAKSMQKSIRKALGIHSPSTVFQEIGNDTGTGIEVGFTSTIPALTQAVQSAAQAMAATGRSLVPQPLTGPLTAVPPASSPPRVPAGPAPVVNVTIVNRGVISSRAEVLNWLTGALDTLKQQGRLVKA